ncbi:MAG: hypothetical protein K0S16_1694, partial [Moraxellaceae bacterium]|nr:hypothetical protein [Moraxellaceae bacterium]
MKRPVLTGLFICYALMLSLRLNTLAPFCQSS